MRLELLLTRHPPASWTDHARDLLLMINHFRKQMPHPIVGIGHSFGGCQMYIDSDHGLRIVLITSQRQSCLPSPSPPRIRHPPRPSHLTLTPQYGPRRQSPRTPEFVYLPA